MALTRFANAAALFLPVLPTPLRWHLSVSPTLVLARSANDAGASTAAQSGRTRGTAQLPYGSGETKGELLLRSQAKRKAATLRVRQVERSWHLPALPTLLRSYPTGQASRKE